MTTPAQVWSCGGGTQSAAIAALILQGTLPKPDHALIVDTKRERSATWAYAASVLIPALAAAGVELVRVDRDDYTDIDLYGGADGETILVPMYAAPAGKLGSYCSGEWKRDVAMRYMRRTLKLEAVVNWIGYSTEEMRRLSTPRRVWCQLRFPLIEDVPMNRNACERLIRAMGWPPAPRSSCWMCPHHSDDEWQDLKDSSPAEFAQAVAFEREHGHSRGLFLNERRVPLDQINFRERAGLFAGDACTGECFT